MKKTGKIFSFIVSLLIFAFILLMRLSGSDFLQKIDLQFVDLFFKLRGKTPPDSRVVIVAIDEKSLEHLGRWPWKRSIIARGIEEIEKGNPGVIGLDIVFAEPDHSYERESINYFMREFKDSILNINNEYRKKITLIDENIKRMDRSVKLLKRNLPYSQRKRARTIESYIFSIKKQLNQLVEHKNFAQKLQSRFTDYKKKIDQDVILGETLRQYDNIVLGYFFYANKNEAKSINIQKLKELERYTLKSKIPVVIVKDKTASKFIPSMYAIRSNIEKISQGKEHFGFFNAFPDSDGVYRKGILIAKYQNYFLPSLSLEMAIVGMGVQPKLSILTKGVFLDLGTKSIPLTDEGKILINYRGPSKTFKTVSFYDVISGKIKKDFFKGKYVLIGATATAIFDLRPTPFEKVYPGVETHANIIDNIINEGYLRTNIYTYFIEVVAMILLWLIVTLSLIRFNSFLAVTLSILSLLAYTAGVFYAFIDKNYVLSVVYPTSASFISFVALLSFKLFTEERTKKKYREAFQKYVSASVVEEILKEPERLKLGGEKRDLTVLFSDIRGFTSISESLDPVLVADILHEFLTPMTEIIFENMGMLDKYMGDAIMAVFGAPLYREDHALLAVRAGVKMIKTLPEINSDLLQRNIPPIDIGIGVNTGEMVVGNMGSSMLFDYTVIGDNVNLGSRLEGLNKVYGTNIIISEFTRNKIKDNDEFVLRELDMVKVKGKLKPVKIYEVVTKEIDIGLLVEGIKQFEKGLAHYFKQEWEMAIFNFESSFETLSEDNPSRVYIERCRLLKNNPPGPDWDGVFEAKTK